MAAPTPAQRSLMAEMEKFVGKYESATRPLQKKQFLCQAACVDANGSADQYSDCLERCSEPMVQLNQVFQQEMRAFQGQFVRCAERCDDKIRKQFKLGPGDQLRPEHEPAMLSCIDSCASAQLELLPPLSERLDSALRRH